MARILLILLILNSSCGYIQYNYSNKSIDELVNEIEIENELLSQAVGFAGESTEQYARFEELKKKATKEELIKLTKHQNPVVRCYSFWGLTDRKEDNLFSILIEHLQDTSQVQRMFGCIVSNVSVADFYIELLTKKYLITEDYYRENNTKVNIEEKRILDSIVLYTPNNLEYLERVLWNHEPNEKDYFRIREIVESGNYIGLPALARYQKNEDFKLILSFKDTPLKQNMYPHPFKCLFIAIENFPNEDFKDFLIEYSETILPNKHFSSYWKNFYSACLKYNEEFSLRILNRILEQKENIPMFKYHLDFITDALGRYPSKENKDLIFQIWRDYKRIAKGSFKFLAENEPNKTFELVSIYLEDFEEVYQGGSEEKLVPVVLEFSLNHNEEKTIQLIANNLRTNTITPFKKFAEYAIELKREEFIEPLFYRIGNEWNGYVFFGAIDIILSYERDDLNKRIIPASRKNKKIIDKYTTREEIENSIKERLNEK
jgi:hypothetical protein